MKIQILAAAVLAATISGATAALAQAMDPLPAGDAAPIMIVDTETFVSVASGSNAFELQSSPLAKDKGVEGHVIELADMIIADHTQAGEKLAKLLESQDMTPPAATLSPRHQRTLEQLQSAKGADFEALYLDIQAQAHMEAIALFRTYAGSGDNQTIVGFARETLPRLETHLGRVKELLTGDLT